MGRALVNFLLSIMAVLLLIVGAALLVAYLLHSYDGVLAQVEGFIHEKGGAFWVLPVAVLLLVGSVVSYLVASFSPTEPRSFKFNTDLGRVGISLGALEQFIARQAKGLPMVESVRPSVTTSADGKRLRLALQANVVANGSVKNVSEGVQEAVVTAIRDGLGLTDVDTVDVDVTKISAPKGGMPSAPAPVLTGEPVEQPALLGDPTAGAETNDNADETDHPVS